MIKPTIGRVVWYYPGPSAEQQPKAAIIAYVHNDRCVNLVWFDPNGLPNSATSIRLEQPEDETVGSGFCTWMPFQVGQAQKTEDLAKRLGEISLLATGRMSNVPPLPPPPPPPK